MNEEKILDIRDLDTTFQTATGAMRTTRDVNIDLYRGGTVAIVGESGSGESVIMHAAMGILAKSAMISHGNIEFRYRHNDGAAGKVGILTKDKKWIRRHINGKWIAMILQDPITSLGPTMRIDRQIVEGTIWHYHTPKKEACRKAVQLLDEVGIRSAEKCMKAYPYQLSGGMRQRVVTAIALTCNPDLLIYDEPTTTLDAMIQAKIIELIRRVQKERRLSVVYITHDLGIVAKVTGYASVMHVGKIVEKDKNSEIFYDPRHPYTWGLFSAIPDLDTGDDGLCTIPDSSPNLLHEKAGDVFAPRNAYALAIDDKLDPPISQITDSHCTATWFLDPRVPRAEIPTELKRKVGRMKRGAGRYGGEL